VGLLAKGALALLSAGTLITSAALVHSPPRAHSHAHAAPAKAGRETAALGAPAHPSAPAVNALRVGSTAPASTSSRSAGRRSVHLRIAVPGPSGSARPPAVSHRHSSVPSPKSTAPTSTTLQIPASSGTPPASSGGSSGGASGGGPSPGAGSGSGGSGTGSGGSGSGGGGSGSGGSGSGGGGSTGSGSGGGGSTGGGSGGGSEPESSPPPPSGGSGSGPVTTVVNEVTGLLEHTVHGVLGHNARVHTPASTSDLRDPPDAHRRHRLAPLARHFGIRGFPRSHHGRSPIFHAAHDG
jgi:hypothetical protein